MDLRLEEELLNASSSSINNILLQTHKISCANILETAAPIVLKQPKPTIKQEQTEVKNTNILLEYMPIDFTGSPTSESFILCKVGDINKFK